MKNLLAGYYTEYKMCRCAYIILRSCAIYYTVSQGVPVFYGSYLDTHFKGELNETNNPVRHCSSAPCFSEFAT